MLFVGGREVWRRCEERGAQPDTDVVEIDLPRGGTLILLKIGDVGGSNWGFYLRITDVQGGPAPGVRWVEP